VLRDKQATYNVGFLATVGLPSSDVVVVGAMDTVAVPTVQLMGTPCAYQHFASPPSSRVIVEIAVSVFESASVGEDKERTLFTGTVPAVSGLCILGPIARDSR
jgi:hypothetical protein